MNRWSLIGSIGLVFLAIGVVGIAVREYNSYLIMRTVTITEKHRIYPVWGDPFTADLIFVCLITGIFVGGAYVLDWLDRHHWGFP